MSENISLYLMILWVRTLVRAQLGAARFFCSIRLGWGHSVVIRWDWRVQDSFPHTPGLG